VDSSPSSPIISRRSLIRRGAKLAYVVPTVVVAMRVHDAYAKPKDKDKSPFGSPPSR
jgi:hypothetical protein